MSEPIKLTDEVLDRIGRSIERSDGAEIDSGDTVRAIRALRDRAVDVVKDAQRGTCDDCNSHGIDEVRPALIDALREVLP